MSRSGCSDDAGETWGFICWRGAVASAIRGKRGQALLHALANALDAMEEKRLGANAFARDGSLCTLGVVGQSLGVDLQSLEDAAASGEHGIIGAAFNVAAPMAKEIIWLNDEGGPYQETPEHRWIRMRNWVAKQITNQGETA